MPLGNDSRQSRYSGNVVQRHVMPAAIAWGATFAPELIERMAAAIGRDMAAVGVHQPGLHVLVSLDHFLMRLLARLAVGRFVAFMRQARLHRRAFRRHRLRASRFLAAGAIETMTDRRHADSLCCDGCRVFGSASGRSVPLPRVAATFGSLAPSHMTTRQSMPSWAAPKASACAWFPAEIEITPAAR